ncbi:MAG: hypothetical protein V3R25_10265 [Nitrosomonadaceae bacterium]
MAILRTLGEDAGKTVSEYHDEIKDHVEIEVNNAFEEGRKLQRENPDLK